MRGRLRALVVAWLACGCGGHSPPASRIDRDAAARQLGARLIDVLERDDLLGFRELLSARMQERAASERELVELFTSWRGELVPYAVALRDADWTLEHDDTRLVVRFRAIGRAPEPLVHVVDERGALRIDES